LATASMRVAICLLARVVLEPDAEALLTVTNWFVSSHLGGFLIITAR